MSLKQLLEKLSNWIKLSSVVLVETMKTVVNDSANLIRKGYEAKVAELFFMLFVLGISCVFLAAAKLVISFGPKEAGEGLTKAADECLTKMSSLRQAILKTILKDTGYSDARLALLMRELNIRLAEVNVQLAELNVEVQKMKERLTRDEQVIAGEGERLDTREQVAAEQAALIKEIELKIAGLMQEFQGLMREFHPKDHAGETH